MAWGCKWFILSCLLLIIPSMACLSPSSPQQQVTAEPIIVVTPDHLNFVIEAGKAYVSEQTTKNLNGKQRKMLISMYYGFSC